MFVVSMKTGRLRAILACAAVVLGLVLAMAALLSNKDSAAVSSSAQVMTDEARRGYLTALGYTVGETPGQVQEILIPVEFDEHFAAYNALQQTEGMDLTPYRGKRVKCWSYTVTNYPGEPSVLAHLYIYKDTVVGGDISATAQGGFSHGLRPIG